MLEIFLCLYRATRAETSLFKVDASARSFFSKAKGNLFFTFHKTRAHPAVAELDRFFPVHDPFLPAARCFCTYVMEFRYVSDPGRPEYF